MKGKNKYGRMIAKARAGLTDDEVFCSARYVNLLKSISKEITEEDFEEILVYGRPEESRLGWCNGRQIGINIGNGITQSFQGVKLKHDSIIGILGHECGHKNFSNHSLRGKYLEGILQEGKLYPCLPIQENEAEKSNLAQMRDCFEAKNKVALAVVKEAAGYINNVLEDRYIEEKMSDRYPGNIRMGIMRNRTRNIENIPSLQYQLEHGYEEHAIMLNLIAQYAISGTINNWEGYDGECVEILEQCEPAIDKAVIDIGESSRFLATNQILLKIWCFLARKIGEIEADIKEQEDMPEGIWQEVQEEKGEQEDGKRDENADTSLESQQEGSPQLEAAINEFLQQLAQGIRMQEEHAAEEGVPDDVQWSGNWEDEALQDGTAESGNESGNTGQEPLETDREILPSSGQNPRDSYADPSGDSVDLSEKVAEASEKKGNQEKEDALEKTDESGKKNGAAETSEEGKTDETDRAMDSKNETMQSKNACINGNEADKEDISPEGEKEEVPEGRTDADRGSMRTGGKTVPEEENEINVDNALMEILLGLAKEKVEEQSAAMLKEELLNQLNDTQFTDVNEDVQKILVRADKTNGTDKYSYEAVAGMVKRVMRRLHTRLLPFLKNAESDTERGLFIGSQLDAAHMLNPEGRIFQRRNQPGQDLDTVLGVLVDQSESMSGYERLEYARLTALCLYEFARYAGIPIIVYGHHTDGYRHSRLRDEKVYLHSYVEFESSHEDKYRIMGMKPYGANRDGVALSFIGERLCQRPERTKMLLLICDEMPNATDYCGDIAKKDLMQIKRNLNKKGVMLLAAAIGRDKENIKEIYQESYLDITDIEKMPTKIAKQVMKKIRRTG